MKGKSNLKIHAKKILKLLADYGGISASRLEILEERLKDDVIAESMAFGGR